MDLISWILKFGFYRQIGICTLGHRRYHITGSIAHVLTGVSMFSQINILKKKAFSGKVGK